MDINSKILTNDFISFSDIPIELQNPHVIKEHQMFVGVIKQGPDGVALNSSFKNRSNENYLTSLGNTIGK
jgi:regulator of telomere elongation helicase 1